MKATELRIGNWIQQDGKPYTLDTSVMIDVFAHWQEFEEMLFQPVPLTDEWFLKFGCTKDENVQCLYLTSNALSWTRIELDYDGHYNVFLRQKDEYGHEDFILLPAEIEYVHQLQNLYFALSGRELEIK